MESLFKRWDSSSYRCEAYVLLISVDLNLPLLFVIDEISPYFPPMTIELIFASFYSAVV